MKIGIIFATPDQTLRTFIGLRKQRVIPSSAIENRYFEQNRPTFIVGTLDISGLTAVADFTSRVHALSEDLDGFILLIDSTMAHLADGVRDAIFTMEFENQYLGKSPQNRVGAIITPALKHYTFLAQRFDDGKYQKILLLPFDSFIAEELDQVRVLVTRNNGVGGFGQELDSLLGQFRDRQVPKKRVTFPDKHIRDDRPLFFQYGHEEHGFVERHAPHTMTCVLNSDFRFGRRYNPRRHYNVSEEAENDKISGSFISCHSQTGNVTPRTHLNLFPNGYF